MHKCLISVRKSCPSPRESDSKLQTTSQYVEALVVYNHDKSQIIKTRKLKIARMFEGISRIAVVNINGQIFSAEFESLF